LTSFACSFYPLAGYGVYDVEYAKLVGARCFLEMGVDLLDQDGFILDIGSAQCGNALDLGTRYTRRLQSQHGLEITLQLCYSWRHDVCIVDGEAVRQWE
jgi:hypothetical protein